MRVIYGNKIEDPFYGPLLLPLSFSSLDRQRLPHSLHLHQRHFGCKAFLGLGLGFRFKVFGGCKGGEGEGSLPQNHPTRRRGRRI